MRVDTDAVDRRGINCMVFHTNNVADIFEYLHFHYPGYQFAIPLNTYADEFEPYGKDTYVYFVDELMEEFLAYSGLKVVKKESDK